MCDDNKVVVNGMSSGYKAKIRNSSDTVIASATESGGVATVNCSEYEEAQAAGTGATEKIPYDGWKDIVITTAADVTVMTIPGPIYPGMSFQGT